jgi:hypothetical protein
MGVRFDRLVPSGASRVRFPHNSDLVAGRRGGLESFDRDGGETLGPPSSAEER